MSKLLQIFKGDYNEQGTMGMLVDYTAVKQAAMFGENEYRIGVTAEFTQKQLGELSKEFNEFYENAEDQSYWNLDSTLQDFFKSKGFDDVDIVPMGCEIEVPDGNIYYNGEEFYNGELLDTYPTYQWWGGNNRETVFADDSMTVTDVNVTGRSFKLDLLHGTNYSFGGQWNHAALEQAEEGWLIRTWSQWQGSHERGELFEELEDALVWINENDSEVDEDYIAEIRAWATEL